MARNRIRGLHPATKIMRVNFRTSETTVMASAGWCQGQSNFDVFTLPVTVPNESEADRVFDALAEGGKIEMPLKKAFWSPKFGMLEKISSDSVGWFLWPAPGSKERVLVSSPRRLFFFVRLAFTARRTVQCGDA